MSEKKRNIQTILSIIVFTVVLVYLVYHLGTILNIFAKILSVLKPFIIGCGIAFVINIPMNSIEKSLFKNENGRLHKYKRPISMIIAFLFAFLVVGLVMFVVVPELANTINNFGSKFEVFAENVKRWIERMQAKHSFIAGKLLDEVNGVESLWSKVVAAFKDNGDTIIQATYTVFSSVISMLVNVTVGIAFSIYILGQKEKLGYQAKVVCYSFFKENTADELMVFGKIANTAFAKFFAGQFREGIILGTMFAVSMALLRLPYALTIGVLIAFTALIPIFGAFIGLFIGSFLILVENPKYVIWFVILFFVLQFIENNFIYPKLVGGDIGLPAIWVLLAVIVGGDLMGIVGMIVFIPLFSVIYSYMRSIMYRRLKKRNIDVDKKVVPDEVMPLMEGRRRLFAMKQKERAKENMEKEKREKEKTETEETEKEAEIKTEKEETKETETKDKK